MENKIDQTQVEKNKIKIHLLELREQINTYRIGVINEREAHSLMEGDIQKLNHELRWLRDLEKQSKEKKMGVKKAMKMLQHEEIAVTENFNKQQEEMMKWRRQIDKEKEKHNVNMTELMESTAIRKRGNTEIFEVSPLQTEKDLLKQLEAKTMALVNKVTNKGEKKSKSMSYEEAYEKMTKESGVEGIDNIVQVFLRDESEKFAILRRISHLNRELEQYKQDTATLQGEIEKYSTKDSGESKRDMQTKILIQRIEHAKNKETTERAKYQKNVESIENVREYINRCFAMVGCNEGHLGRRFSMFDPAIVDHDTLLKMLGAIEQKLIELTQLALAYGIAKPLHTSDTTPLANGGQAYSFPKTAKSIKIVPPEFNEMSDEEDSGNEDDMESDVPSGLRPLSYKELQNKTAEFVSSTLFQSLILIIFAFA